MSYYKSEVEMFHERPIQSSIISSRDVAYKPFNSLDNESQLEFICPGDSEFFRDISYMRLNLTIKMVKPDGNDFLSSETVQPGCINYLINTLFSEVILYLNDVNVTPNSGNYPYRAIIETLTNYGEDAAKTHLTNGMFYLDTPDTDKALSGSTDNNGFKDRLDILKNSKSVELSGRLHIDMANIPQLLLKNVNIRLKLNRTKPDFYMLSKENTGGKIQILDASLVLKHVGVSPDIALRIEKKLLNNSALYHVNRVEVKTRTIAKGLVSDTVQVSNAEIPNYIICGMVLNTSYVGTRSSNPFQFVHSDLEYVAVYVNGIMLGDPIRVKFDNMNMITAGYQTLFSGLGIHHQDRGHLITKDMFFHGYCLLAFDLTSDGSATESHSSVTRYGPVRVEVRFKSALTNALSFITYCVFDGTIAIDKSRSVSIMY